MKTPEPEGEFLPSRKLTLRYKLLWCLTVRYAVGTITVRVFIIQEGAFRLTSRIFFLNFGTIIRANRLVH